MCAAPAAQGQQPAERVQSRDSTMATRFLAANDRRRMPRANLAAPCPCFFRVRGKRHPAFMVDVSATGAGFRNFELAATLALNAGQDTHFEVITPFGRADYAGCVVWASALDAGHGWGIRLSAPLVKGQGPLGSLLAVVMQAS
jgi:hypothetical protein